MATKIDEARALYGRFFQVVGQTLEQVGAEAETMSVGPADPVRLIRLTGTLVILQRLLDGTLVSLALIAYFLDDKLPAALSPAIDSAAPDECSDEYNAELARIGDYLEARLGAPADAEPVPAA